MEKKPELLKPPTFLKKNAKELYNIIGESLIEEGQFKTGDEVALLALCANYQRWIEAEQLIKKNKDLCFQTESGYRQQIPEISIARDCMKTMLTFLKEFALTPKERIKLKLAVIEKGNNEIDKEMDDMVQK